MFIILLYRTARTVGTAERLSPHPSHEHLLPGNCSLVAVKGLDAVREDEIAVVRPAGPPDPELPRGVPGKEDLSQFGDLLSAGVLDVGHRVEAVLDPPDQAGCPSFSAMKSYGALVSGTSTV